MKWLGALFAMALPAMAQGQSLEDQYSAAHEVFVGTEVGTPHAQLAMSNALMQAAEGRWVDSYSLTRGSTTFDPSQLAWRCGFPDTIIITQDGQFGLSSTNQSNAGGLVYRWKLVQGRQFEVSGAFLDYLRENGIDPDTLPANEVASLLRSRTTDVVQLYTPSPDILVVVDESGHATLYLRCPS